MPLNNRSPDVASNARLPRCMMPTRFSTEKLQTHSVMSSLRFLLCVVIVFVAGCAQPLNEEQYQQFLRDPAHGLVQQVVNGTSTATCTYLPVDLLLARDLGGAEEVVLPAAVDSVRRSYAGRTYFSLSLARGKTEIENQFLSDQLAYAQSLEYLSSGIAQDVSLITPARDSVAAMASTYSRLYGGTKKSTVLLVFDTRTLDLSQGFSVSFRDTRFNLGALRFSFTAAALRGLPALQLENSPKAL